jgi:undecaprenyl-diphosphatase
MLGLHIPGSTLEVALHSGTLLAIFLVLWRDLWQVARDGVLGLRLRLLGRPELIPEKAPLFVTAVAVVLASVPIAVVGFLFEKAISATFDSVVLAGALLCVTGCVLLAVRMARMPRTDRVGPLRGLAIGIVQAFALLPGISRSGVTISAGCMLGVDRRTAGRFSFLAAVPVLIGASLYKLFAAGRALGGEQDVLIDVGALAAGTLVSAVVGAACLLLLLRLVEGGRLHWFAAYCLPAGVLMVLLGTLG